MSKRSTWADDGTDPGIPAPYDDDEIDEIEEISAEELAGGRNGGAVVLGDPSALAAGGAEKTRVANIDDLVPPGVEETVPAGGVGDADKTMITTVPVVPAGKSRGRLVIVTGKEEGKEIDLSDGRHVMGRGKDTDICLLDIQVSRKHCEFEVGANGVVLRDLGSGNGTLVNGEPITETHLVHGDEIQVGDHLLRFEEEGTVGTALAPALRGGRGRRGGGRALAPRAGGTAPAAPVPVPSIRRSSRRGKQNQKKKVLLVAGIAAIVFVGVALKLGMSKKGGAAHGHTGPSKAILAQEEFRKGLGLFKAEKYQEALAIFESVLEANPRHPTAKRYIEASKREMKAAEALAEGRRLLASGDFAGARAAFGRVPAESLKASDAQAGLEEVKQQEAEKYVKQGDEALAADALTEARAAYERALEVVPGFPMASAGIAKVQAREEAKRANDALTEAEKKKRLREERAAAAARARAAIKAELAPAVRAFDQRNFGGAVSKFNQLARESANPRVRTLAKKRAAALKKFKPAFDRGMAAVKARKAQDAVHFLSTALVQGRLISPDGRVVHDIVKQLSDMLYLQGRVAFNEGRYGDAFKAWAKALKINPAQSYARDGLKDLKDKGKHIYLEAYTQRTLNRAAAIRKLKQVLTMTPENFEYHMKARKLLEELSN